ncbi:FAD-binding oxidoreductase [Candidatus Daviesbacteria bacterium]|nr:FAD-binding oxidoreductase [Candidatus Daviesbacteria bacterium]
MTVTKFESIWTGTTPVTDYPELSKDLVVDVIIIGGGITGINAAYFLKSQGQKVAIIEANKIATGTSGNTTAKITSLHELRYAYLMKKFGKNSAQIYADANQWAIKEVENIINKEDIECDFVKAPAFTYTRTKRDLDRIKQEVEAAKDLNLPASFVTEIQNFPFGIFGAVKFDNQAYFHPRKYLLKLAEKINIFEKTRALDIKEGSSFCEVKTNRKNIRGKFIIIATNFPFYDPYGIFTKIYRTGSYALAARVAKIPDGMFLGAQGDDLSFRPHNEWLIIGGKHHNIDEIGNINERFNELVKLANKDFQISSTDYMWGAQDTMSLDQVPYIGKMPQAKRIFVATGFSAWGMTTGVLAAKLLTDLILERKNDWQEFYSPARLRR